mmetsp:Transcript_19396/g.65533  ORF Transcript_19396/g.65533 Transcript_19396/m.65533 type:complete len:132 (-) Transcript_19396:43-438(-)
MRTLCDLMRPLYGESPHGMCTDCKGRDLFTVLFSLFSLSFHCSLSLLLLWGPGLQPPTPGSYPRNVLKDVGDLLTLDSADESVQFGLAGLVGRDHVCYAAARETGDAPIKACGCFFKLGHTPPASNAGELR